MSAFNVRAYGFLINDKNEVLVSDEREYGMEFTKFPGGGVELGEGIADALIREFKEECGFKVELVRHIYTTDEYVKSQFHNNQVIAVYYLVKAAQEEMDTIVPGVLPLEGEPAQAFRWVPVENFDIEQLTFRMDRIGWKYFITSLSIS